jgi:hypothetical protein
VAYFTKGFVYHHHVARISDWIRKWSRNFKYHLVDKQETRNMRWVFTGNFTLKLIWWVFYSCIPVFSFMHSVYLACKEKNRYWLYHSFVCLAQSITYIYLVFSLKEARKLILKKGLLHLKGKNYENFSYSA